MAILGNNVNSGGIFSGGAGRKVASKFNLATAQTLQELHTWFYTGTGSHQVCLHIHSDSSGNPGALVAYTNLITVPDTGDYADVNQTGFSVPLAAGDYWLGITTASAKGNIAGTTGGIHRAILSGATVYPPSNPFGTPDNSGTNKFACWAVVGAAAIPPVAGFTGTPLSGTEPLSVTFTDTSTNTPTSWAWTFGDGGTSTAQNPSHSYTAAGTYTVALTATNAAGSNTLTRTGYVTVADQPRPIRINTSQGWADIGDATAFVSGSGAPTAAVGATGAIYLDTATGRMYGQKTGGAWPGTPIAVPAGSDATTSAKGIVQLAGDLTGDAASPQIAAGVIVDGDVAAANKDGAATTPSLRTLGTGAQQAAAGNDSRLLKAAVAYSTSLPGSPVDGQEVILVNSTSSPSYYWHMRYMASSTFPEKWVFIGGTSWQSYTAGAAALTVGSWASLLPGLQIPFNGAYTFVGQALFNPAAAGLLGLSGWHDGARDDDFQTLRQAQGSGYEGLFTAPVGKLFTLGDTITLASYAGAACNVQNRMIQLTPVRLR